MPYIGNTIRAADDYRLIDDISSGFNGSTTSFALQVAGSAPVPFPKSPQQVLISVNGVIQEPDPTGSSGFNLVGTNIVFSSAPTNGHAFFGIIYATADYLNAGGNFPAGSLGAPSITFIGDENTGLFRKSGGSVGFVSDATEIANFDSNGITISSGNIIIPDSIIHNGDSDTKIRFPSGNTISFETGGTEKFRVDGGGHVSIGTNTSRTVGGAVERKLQVEGADGSAGISIIRNQNSASPPALSFGKQRSGSSGGNTIVQDDDKLGTIQFCGADGSDVTTAAATIQCEVDGTPGSNDMPGRLVFSTTADGASSATERMRIDSSGRVGINETALSSFNSIGDDLVISQASGSAGITIRSGTSNTGVLAFTDGANTSFRGDVRYDHNGDYMRFSTDGNERMRIASDGQLRIGTTSTGTASVVIDSELGSGSVLRFIGKSSNDGSEIDFYADNNSTRLGYLEFNNTVTKIVSETAVPLSFYTNGGSNERMRIDSSGNVGIGTTSPQRLLHQHEDSSAANYHQFTNTTTGAGSTNGLLVGINQDENGLLWHYGSQPMRFATGNTERMRIDASGNVGIGTTSPDSVLDITSDTPLITFNSTVTNLGADNLIGAMKVFKSDASGSGSGICGSLSWRSDDSFGARTYIQFTNRQNSTGETNTDSECMRIGGGASGNVNIGTSTVLNLGANNVTGINLLSTGRLIACSTGNASQFGRQGSSGKVIQFACQGTNDVGSIQVTTTSTTLVSGSSDRRTKKNFEDWTEDTLSLFKNLKPQKFNFKIEDDGTEKTKGYIAQDLVDSFPEAYPKNDDDKYMFAPQGMIVYLMKAIQELEAEVAALKAA